jgi:hypothetical protein
MLADEVMSLGIGLYSYDNFFEQGAFLFVYFVLFYKIRVLVFKLKIFIWWQP